VARWKGFRADDFRQKLFRTLVAVKHAIFTAFLVVEYELDSDPGTAWPGRMDRLAAVSNEVSRVVLEAGHGNQWSGKKRAINDSAEEAVPFRVDSNAGNSGFFMTDDKVKQVTSQFPSLAWILRFRHALS
jgi:hypothetical protein